jgi:protein associated with RNAse G/E
MKPGDVIWTRVYKSDGSPHRWWQALVEEVTEECLVTYTKAGNPVFHNPGRFPNGIYYQKHDIRNYYWPGRRHDMLEVYWPDGRLYELYADITSPVEIVDGEVRFVDHELDVQMFAGQTSRIIDQDEFAEAALVYNYTEEFMAACYAQAEELLPLLAQWQPVGFQARINLES